MKRCCVLLTVVSFLSAVGSAQRITPPQRHALDQLPAQAQVKLDRNQVPSWVMGNLGRRASTDPVASADTALRIHKDLFRASADDSFAFSGRMEKDQLGQTHVRMTQKYKGLEVIGGEAIVHMTNEEIIGINARFVPDINMSTTPAIRDHEASAFAVRHVAEIGGRDPAVKEIRGLVVFVDEKDVPHLAYPVQVSYTLDESPKLDDIFVDAISGSVVGVHPRIWDSKYRQIYNAGYDCSYPVIPGPLVLSEGGSTSDPYVLAAYNNLGTTYDYYWTRFGRDSFNGSGAAIPGVIHYCANYNNAFWDGSYLVFGDGDSVSFGPFETALDVVAHELTHAVTQYTANLTYSYEPGALNESMSDIFGAATEARADGGVSADTWKVGEDIYTPSTPGDALRYMDNPTLDGSSTDYYPERYTGSNDNGGVHWNSGISNLAFYLLSQGGHHPRNKTAVTVSGIGITTAEQIFYRALTVGYLVSNSNFQSARDATAQAAADLYGRCSATWTSVQQAWDAVGVPGTWSCVDCTATPWCGGSGNVVLAQIQLKCSQPTQMSTTAVACGYGCSTVNGPSGVLTSSSAMAQSWATGTGTCVLAWSYGGRNYSQTLHP